MSSLPPRLSACSSLSYGTELIGSPWLSSLRFKNQGLLKPLVIFQLLVLGTLRPITTNNAISIASYDMPSPRRCPYTTVPEPERQISPGVDENSSRELNHPRDSSVTPATSMEPSVRKSSTCNPSSMELILDSNALLHLSPITKVDCVSTTQSTKRKREDDDIMESNIPNMFQQLGHVMVADANAKSARLDEEISRVSESVKTMRTEHMSWFNEISDRVTEVKSHQKSDMTAFEERTVHLIKNIGIVGRRDLEAQSLAWRTSFNGSSMDVKNLKVEVADINSRLTNNEGCVSSLNLHLGKIGAFTDDIAVKLEILKTQLGETSSPESLEERFAKSAASFAAHVELSSIKMSQIAQAFQKQCGIVDTKIDAKIEPFVLHLEEVISIATQSTRQNFEGQLETYLRQVSEVVNGAQKWVSKGQRCLEYVLEMFQAKVESNLNAARGEIRGLEKTVEQQRREIKNMDDRFEAMQVKNEDRMQEMERRFTAKLRRLEKATLGQKESIDIVKMISDTQTMVHGNRIASKLRSAETDEKIASLEERARKDKEESDEEVRRLKERIAAFEQSISNVQNQQTELTESMKGVQTRQKELMESIAIVQIQQKGLKDRLTEHSASSSAEQARLSGEQSKLDTKILDLAKQHTQFEEVQSALRDDFKVFDLDLQLREAKLERAKNREKNNAGPEAHVEPEAQAAVDTAQHPDQNSPNPKKDASRLSPAVPDQHPKKKLHVSGPLSPAKNTVRLKYGKDLANAQAAGKDKGNQPIQKRKAEPVDRSSGEARKKKKVAFEVDSGHGRVI
ncbi:hypothetical protein IQ07DRAFT_631983 [Pyrenochaeta sp. DS3sAY3a]|nr:hypothetical protein IQ07DRAFT_631983 [Pyrenochaeta sp. DS3sAY3a]